MSGRPRGDAVAAAWPVQLALAAHPLHAVVTALGLGATAWASGRAGRESVLVAVTVVVGQALLGWHNDLVDSTRDSARARPGKPLASGALDAGSAWFAVACAVLVLVPLSLGNGLTTTRTACGTCRCGSRCAPARRD